VPNIQETCTPLGGLLAKKLNSRHDRISRRWIRRGFGAGMRHSEFPFPAVGGVERQAV
jgi:uncharacterized protein (DUF111 family)